MKTIAIEELIEHCKHIGGIPAMFLKERIASAEEELIVINSSKSIHNEHRKTLPSRWLAAMNEYEELLLEANDLLRSTFAIALREGVDVNWVAFRKQVDKALIKQRDSGIFPREDKE